MGKIFKGIWGIIKLIFGSKEKELNKYAADTLKVIEVIKKVFDNPLLDIVVELTKTNIDNELLDIFRAELDEIQKELTNNIAINGNIATTLRQLDNTGKDTILYEISVRLYKKVLDEKGIVLNDLEVNKYILTAASQLDKSLI